MMFRGINAVNLDAKGRLAVPTRYRACLQNEAQNRVIITVDTEEHCLLMYPLPAWEEIEQKIAALPSFNKVTRRIQRLLIGHATDAELDSHGRILLTPPLREYAGLEKEAMLIGQGKKFEIWDRTHWQQGREGWLKDELLGSKELPEELRSISL